MTSVAPPDYHGNVTFPGVQHLSISPQRQRITGQRLSKDDRQQLPPRIDRFDSAIHYPLDDRGEVMLRTLSWLATTSVDPELRGEQLVEDIALTTKVVVDGRVRYLDGPAYISHRRPPETATREEPAGCVEYSFPCLARMDRLPVPTPSSGYHRASLSQLASLSRERRLCRASVFMRVTTPQRTRPVSGSRVAVI